MMVTAAAIAVSRWPMISHQPHSRNHSTLAKGHTIHRHARIHTEELGGQRLAVSSPQGWASEAAEAVDGKVLERVDAHGKHLLYRFEDDLTVHVHLGLFGKFRRYKLPGPPARDTTRLRFIGEERGMDLAGAMISQLIDPAAEDELMARLGPDPLRRHARADRLRTALARRKIPVGAALLDQSVIAGWATSTAPRSCSPAASTPTASRAR